MQWYLKDSESHCEIIMPWENGQNNKDSCLAYGVTSEKGVFKEKRLFSRQSYKFLYLAIDQQVLTRVRTFCENQIGKPYNKWGMFWSALWPIDEREDCYWCAHFVARVLKEADIIKYYRSTALETSEIIRMIKHHSQIIGSVTPHRYKTAIEPVIGGLFSQQTATSDAGTPKFIKERDRTYS